MKKIILLAVLLLLAGSVVWGGRVWAQTGPVIERSVIASTSGSVSGSNFRLEGILGEPLAGSITGGNYVLRSGFLVEGLTGGNNLIYLPLVLKN